LRILSLEAYPKMHKKYIRNSGFGNWMTEIGSIEKKLKDKNLHLRNPLFLNVMKNSEA
jgi:hypothetical protein